MVTKFVNRKEEFEYLRMHKKFIGKKNHVVLLCGKGGVGKSELTRRFIQENLNEVPSIKVSIQQAEKNTYNSGYYLTKLARALHEFALTDDRIFSLSDFFKQRRSSEVVFKKRIENLKSDVSALIPFSATIKGITDIFSESGEFDANKFFESTHSDVLLALFEYVKSECRRVSMIINFENIQSIDGRSLELLTPIIRESNNCLYLLEFTDNDDTGYNFHDIILELEENGIGFEALTIGPLNLSDVKKVIQDQPGLSWELIERSYVDWNGNMRSLVDLIARIKYGLSPDIPKNIDLNSATPAHLHSLSANDLFLLTLILVHKEPVQISLLNKIITYRESLQYILDIKYSLRNLENRSLIRWTGDEVVLAHDSIAEHLSRIEKYDLFAIIGQKFWLNTYEELLASGDVYSSQGWLLMKVLYFASLLNYDARILDLLNKINEEAIQSRDPEKMIEFVLGVRTSLLLKDERRFKEKITKIDYWLIELYYKIGNSKDAWEILSNVSHSSNKYNVLKAILLEQIGSHSEAIKFCNDQLNELNKLNPNYELSLRLVRLVANFDIGESGKTMAEFAAIYKNKKFVNLFEYGFLLRNAELVFNYQESLPYYKKSIAHFIKRGATHQAAFSRITYGVHLGLVGRYEMAHKQFDLAEKELRNVISERHSLLNNFAVLLLFQKRVESNADELLRQALLTAQGDFERLAITMNYLVLMDWRDNRIEAELSIKAILRILEKPKFASKDIIRCALFDIFKFYERIGDGKNAQLFANKLKSLNLPESPIWKFWLYNEAIPSSDEEFHLSVIDRAVSFLCNWNMEYDNSLMRYE
jgi:predicted transcriptional regulator/GTPase SAR1 family protein